MDKSIFETKITRREFIQGLGAFTFFFGIGLPDIASSLLTEKMKLAADAPVNNPNLNLNIWVTLGTDDSLTILTPGAEMGQGSSTSLPLILAEELDADWSKVKVEFAPPDAKKYGNPLLGGRMLSVASFGIAGYYTPLRLAGAQARRVLLESVAKQWNLPIAELRTESSRVIHEKSRRSISYGDIAKFTIPPAIAPQVTVDDLKKTSEFRLIGQKGIKRIDIPSMVNGTALYSIDAQVPGMIYATVVESPMDGAKAENIHSDDAMKIPGVIQVIAMPFGVAILAKTMEACFAGYDVLKVSWNTSGIETANFSSDTAMKKVERICRDTAIKGTEWYKQGDAAKAFSQAAKMLEAEYQTSYCYHAQLETMNCIAKVHEDGQSAEIWVGTQDQVEITTTLANILKTSPDKIIVHQHVMGGTFGRRTKPDTIVQAMELSKISKLPVKLILNRKEDFVAARPRPMTFQALKAAFDDKNQLIGWHQRLVAESVDARVAPARYKASGGKELITWQGMDMPFYHIPNVYTEGVRAEIGIRVHNFRSTGLGYTKFAIESFIDEIAHAQGQDPLDFRLDLTKDHPHAHSVIQIVGQLAGWKRPRKNFGLGVAFGNQLNTVIATVAEVSIDQTTNKIKVRHLWTVVDMGIVIQPDCSEAQIEGATLFGLSVALFENLEIKEGAVVQSNFTNYPIARMQDIPNIHVHIVDSQRMPSGAGEIGIVPVAPAIANAVFELTGKRLRALPLQLPS